MTRLIDADALKEYIDCGHLRNPCEVCFSELDVVNLIDEQPTVDIEPRWIPCSERLPEEDFETGKGVQYSDFVLMSVEHKEDEETIVDYGHTVDGEWYSDYTDCFIPQEWKVIAWMPLPKPYEVKE